MGKYFGTDGFRGEANVDLTVEHAYKVGRFLGWYYGKQAKVRMSGCLTTKTSRRSVMTVTLPVKTARLLPVTGTPARQVWKF